MRSSIPNFITLSRIFLTIPICIALNNNNLTIAWFLFLIASLTDLFDGYLARKFLCTSKFGAVSDPLADKLLVILIYLWLTQNMIIPFWSLWLLISRELTVTLLRSSEKSGQPSIPISKIKTFFQFCSIFFLILPFNIDLESNLNLQNIGILFYWLSLYTSVISALVYINPRLKNYLKNNQD
ncbi:CDP-diacylglycerol--glycerol-3-phosphate 3-phosphatidyltransferase [Prochlorococcus sp. MIT 0601]|uniref:CDP-diacylglycerol--glycerol-3-phosphate 3-phosphatidyltransferase n=1 Tax=Prochlorococcus marinus TaxID=1219 RepID=UPI00053377CE|nr:CDP-diacylglycerol--glycerol-3-phosphate 3-phosphatidyltransferase [Prochlorococcus sp. MIT 0601]